MGENSERGFAAMDPESQRQIASKGGKAAHEKGTAHEFSSEEAAEAGRKGGRSVSRNREHMAAIGRTNDAILYAGRAIVWVVADDAQIAEIGPKVPSSASPEYGALFGELFAKYKDFYKIDPMLFSPAEIVFCNLRNGRVQKFDVG